MPTEKSVPEHDAPKEKAQEIKVKRTRRRVYEQADPCPAPVDSAQSGGARSGGKQAPVSQRQTVNMKTREEAGGITKRYAAYAAGVGLVPMPLLDLAALSALQVSLIEKISKLYGVPFNQVRAEAIVGGILGGWGAVSAGGLAAVSLMRFAPVFGLPFAAATMPTMNAAVTWAIGKALITHYELAGTLMTLDPEEVKRRYQKELANCKRRKKMRALL